jgi:hypothetical protein
MIFYTKIRKIEIFLTTMSINQFNMSRTRSKINRGLKIKRMKDRRIAALQKVAAEAVAAEAVAAEAVAAEAVAAEAVAAEAVAAEAEPPEEDDDIFENIVRSLVKHPLVLVKFKEMMPMILTLSSFKEILLLLLSDPFVFVDVDDDIFEYIVRSLMKHPHVLVKFNEMMPMILTLSSFKETLLLLLY